MWLTGCVNRTKTSGGGRSTNTWFGYGVVYKDGPCWLSCCIIAVVRLEYFWFEGPERTAEQTPTVKHHERNTFP